MVHPASRDNLLRWGFFCPWLILLTTVAGIADTGGRSPQRNAARQILDATGVTGGLIVHLGCGDGKLTAALYADDSYVIQGLDTDADQVRQARTQVQSQRIYGPVSIDRFDGKQLPYRDNLVNLVLADDLGNVTMAEAMRVLAPGGVLYTQQGGRWTKTVKPRPENIDDWTHYFHDASGNAVAHDEVVGPPGRFQWIAGPRHTRSHEHIPGIQALVSSGGRIFYIVDEAAIASIRRLPQWNLVARDAFNGTLLWKRPIASWFPEIVNWGQTPRELQRKLVAVGDRVYVTLGLHAPLSAVDAATGKTVKVYENTGGTEEVVLHQGILLLAVRSVTEEKVAELARWAELALRRESPLDERDSAEPLVKRLRATEAQGEKSILALDAASGSMFWKTTGANVAALRTYSLSADGDRLFYQNGREVICQDLKTGRRQWSAAAAPLRLVHGGSVFCVDGKTVTALSAENGRTQWTKDASLISIRDVFLAGGSLWIGGFKPIKNKRGPAWGPYFVTQRDPATGEMLMQIEPENPGHHHRCYANKATDRYILGGRRGTEFIDLDSGDVLWNSWVRGVCKYGVMPSNGLLYAPPHACGCYMGAKLTDFNALAPRRKADSAERTAEDAPPAEHGPAFDAPLSASGSPLSTDWPTYRHDARRSGCTPTPLPAKLSRRWQTVIGGKLSSLTVADGKVFVASPEEHRVSALDADSGEVLWHVTAGARVDSPPTLYQGRAIFGCRDGHLYSVRASDGELAWRLRAARNQRQIVVYGQLESVWPVHGSVLLKDGVLYLTAGRSSYTDGGIDLCRVEPGTGKTLSITSIYSPDRETGKQPPQFAPAAMPGARADILTSDDRHVYLREMVFDDRGGPQTEGKSHLLTLTDFLDGSWPHRSYWIFGTHLSVATGCSGRERDLVYGRFLVFNDSTLYGYGRKTVHWSNQLQDGPYRLFALRRPGSSEAWARPIPIQVRAMLLAGKTLFVAGPFADTVNLPQAGDENRPALLVAISASDGTELARYRLDSSPVFDGLVAAGGRLYVSQENGQLLSMGED